MKERLKNTLGMLLGIGFWFGIGFLFYKYGGKSNNSYNPNNPLEPDYYEDGGSSIDRENKCGYSDGSHSATVDYYNPNTGYSASYDLEVEVEDCNVTTIYFPKGGWLDDSHINTDELDSDGNATIEDDRGRTYEVHIED